MPDKKSDYTTMTADELDAAKQQQEAIRAGAKAEMVAIQKAQDTLVYKAKLTAMPEGELAALKQMVAAEGVASGEKVGKPGA